MPAFPHGHLLIEERGDVTVVRFRTSKIVIAQCIEEVGEELFQLLDEPTRRKIRLDFDQVTQLSSAALGKFITFNKKVYSTGGRLVLCNLNPKIYEVFATTKLDKLFNFETKKDDDNPEEARGDGRAN
jgi:anti-anti-sigma factor